MRAMSLILTIMLVLGASLGAVVAYDRLVVAPMREQLTNPLVDRALLGKVLDAMAKGRVTPERPLVLNMAPQGAPQVNIPPVPVTLFIREPAPSTRPGEEPGKPKLVADSPGIYCRTKEECDRIYARAPQALTVDAQIRTGTLVVVCTDPLDAAGRCPEGKRANLPLAEPLKFNAQFVLAERGVFQGLNVVGSPVEITRVRTETAIETRLPAPPLPYHLAAFIRGGIPGADVTAGLRYVNRIGGGFYEFEPAIRYDPGRPPGHRTVSQVWLTYVQPIR